MVGANVMTVLVLGLAVLGVAAPSSLVLESVEMCHVPFSASVMELLPAIMVSF